MVTEVELMEDSLQTLKFGEDLRVLLMHPPGL